MGEVHQHPDGHIFVRTPEATYSDTIENFRKDFGEEVPNLPEGADERVYTQGVRHAMMGGGNVIEGGPRQWAVGDRWIERVSAGIQKQQSRRQKL